jgi:hypothetical protein
VRIAIRAMKWTGKPMRIQCQVSWVSSETTNDVFFFRLKGLKWTNAVFRHPYLDQLSRRTFGQTMNYTPTSFPIYPLTPPPSLSRTHSPNSTSGGEMARTME